ncbi:MAG: CCA tRNA nucleotidyltransferase [Solobacterium sp.]|nr:CCA tRNA nucleotidyltransferase [Solobacterium sp.]
MIIPDWVRKPVTMLNDAGYECFVVGGAVRNALMHRDINDYDLTTNALPEEMKQVFSGMHMIETGIKHGTLTVMSGGCPVEITTYRTDGVYTDHRHPDQVVFTGHLEDDCARRDFTINGMAWHWDTGILDFYGGRQDIQDHLVRCIGRPRERFNEDALRILRALRFASQFAFTVEKETAAAAHSMKELLGYVSKERIRNELLKLLEGRAAGSVFREFTDIFAVFLPFIDPSAAGTLSALLERSPADPMVRAALLIRSSGDPERVLRDLRFSGHEMTVILNLIRLEDMPMQTRIDLRYILRDLKTDFDMYLNYRCALDSSLDEVRLRELYDTMLRDHDCCSLKDLSADGSTLLKHGYRGKELGRKLNEILTEVIEGRLGNTPEEIERYLAENA